MSPAIVQDNTSSGGQSVNIQIIPIESTDPLMVEVPLEQPMIESATPRLRAADLCL